MKKTFSYFCRDKFEEYLEKLNNVDRPKQKAGYLGSIHDNVLVPLGCGILISDIEKAINYTKSTEKVFEGLDVIFSFLKKLVWINHNVQVNSKIQDFFDLNELNQNSVNSWPSVISDYKEFLNTCLENGTITPKTSLKLKYGVTDWNNAMKKLARIEIEILSMKGTNSLLSRFAGDKDFLSVVLKDSYFLSSELAKTRYDAIAKSFNNNVPLFARQSKDTKIQSNGLFHYISEVDKSHKDFPFIVDKDGNTEVKNLIEDNTGYTVSAGYDSIFLFYIISHIWGDAFDPRNFTNFWNIVIVPAWANFILDKQGVQDELAKKMINTFKAICIKHYKMRSMRWKRIDKDFKNIEPDPNYVVGGEYTINVINRKSRKQNYGKIDQIQITIETPPRCPDAPADAGSDNESALSGVDWLCGRG